MSKALLAAALMACSTGSALADPNDMALCRRMVDAWKAAFNAHDAAKVAAMYDPEAGVYSNPFWTATGRTALERGLQADIAMDVRYDSIVCDEADRKGPILVGRGTFAGSSKGPGGQTMPIAGHWLSWVRDGGGGAYRIMAHNANVQLPPPK